MSFSAPTLAGTATSTTSSTSHTLTTAVDIPAGALAFLAAGMDTTSSHTIGITSVTPAAGAFGTWTKSGANRASTIAEHLWTAPVSTTIPSGTVVTVVTPSNHAKFGLVLAFTTDHNSSTPDLDTGDPASGNVGSVTYGSTGTTTISFSAGTSSSNGELFISALGVSGTGTLTPSGGWTTLAEARTTTGSSDRGVAVVYYVQPTAGSQSVTGSLSSGAWAGSAQSFVPAVTSVDATVNAVPMTATASAPAPAVSGSVPASVTAVVMTATADTPIPVVEAGFEVSGGGPMAATASMPTPAVTASMIVSVVKMTATATMPNPIAGGGTDVSVPAMTATATMYPSEADGGGDIIIDVPVIDVTAEFPTPALAAAGNVTAVRATSLATMRDPAVLGQSSPTIEVPAIDLLASFLTPDVSTLTRYLFTPPYGPVHSQFSGDRLWDRVTTPQSTSVLKADGYYLERLNPTYSEAAAADIAYIGGHIYEVSEAEASALTSAGYGEWLTYA